MKLLFLQPGYAHYRDQFFELLSTTNDILFLYEHTKRDYPGKGIPANINYCFATDWHKFPLVGILLCLLQTKPDIVITSVSTALRTIIAYIYSVLFRKKFILWIEEWRYENRIRTLFDLLRKIKYSLGRHIITKSDALIAGGTASYNYAISLNKNRSEIFFSIQSIADLRKDFENGLTIKKTNNKKTFLYLSRIIDWKGLDLLILAFYLLKKERKDIALLIAGDGPFKSYCALLCNYLNINDVTFAGSIDPNDLSQVYEKGDIFVLPTYFLNNHYEAWGLVINEATSMSLPIITTSAVGAAYDLVENEINGFIVEQNNIYELFNAMKKMLNMNLQLASNNSRRIFENKNSNQNMVDEFNKAIRFVSES